MSNYFHSIPKKAVYYGTKEIEYQGQFYIFELWTWGNNSGFVHLGFLEERDNEYNMVKNVSARAQYYNRTWERWTGESVLKECLRQVFPKANYTEIQKIADLFGDARY